MDEEDETLVDSDSNRGRVGGEAEEPEEQRELSGCTYIYLSLFRLR